MGRTDWRAQTTYEPINNAHPTIYQVNTTPPTPPNPLWLTGIYDNLGYTAYTATSDKAIHFNSDQRIAWGTDWAFTIFVANSLNDADGMFTDSWFAYAYLGGPIEIQTYSNDSWGISQMNVVTRHETSHIFYGLDEYSASGCTCSGTSGYVSYPNQNCNASCLTNVLCIMNEWNRQQNVCSYTGGMIGWGDSDSDNIPDPVDIDPDTALTAYLYKTTTRTQLNYSGTATIQARTNQTFYGYICDINILTIANVEWRVDSGPWTSATPSDGSFDSASEGFQFAVGPLSVGIHTIQARAIDELGQMDSVPGADSVTIVPGAPGVPSGISGTAMQASKMDSGGNVILVTWDVGTCPGQQIQTSIVCGGGSQLPASYGGIYGPPPTLLIPACFIRGSMPGQYLWGGGPVPPPYAPPNPLSDPTRFYWWVLVDEDAYGHGTEGSWGQNSGNVERTGPGLGGSSSLCGYTFGKNTYNPCGTP